MPENSSSHDPQLAADLHIQATYQLTEALVESENRMRRRIELLSEIVFETDQNGILVFLNHAWSKALGHTVEGCLGRDLSQFVVLEDRTIYSKTMRGAGTAGSAVRPRLRLVRADDGIAWMEISAAQLADGGVVGALHDITVVKKAEAELTKLSLVASSTDNLVIITDREGRTEWVNRAFTQLTGYSLDEMAGRKPGEILQGRDTDPDTIVQIRAALAEGLSFKGEVLNYTRAGLPYWVFMQISPIRDAHGRVERFVSIQSDSTERRRTQRELIAAKERAEQLAVQAQAASQAKSEFLASMSHEIRTPIHGVLGMTELLLNSQLDNPQRELADDIARSGEALLGIINDILDLSKIEAGRMTLVAEEFDLRPLIESVGALLSRSGHGKSVVVQSVCDARVPTRFKGDPGRLRQVLLNLMGNGLKFTATGSVVTRILPLSSDTDSMWLRFEVIDTGAGIAPEKLALLFQPFQQLDSSHSRRHGGTGLGLAISRRIVELMGGRIGVESAVAKGSTFWFEISLPYVAATVPPTTEASTAGMRVLVAQDHELVRRLLLLSLEKLGCQAEIASTGQEVLQRLQQVDFDAVILSIELADMDAICLATSIRQLEKNNRTSPPMRLVVSLNQSSDEERARLLACGIDDTMGNPPGQSRLKEVLLGSSR